MSPELREEQSGTRTKLFLSYSTAERIKKKISNIFGFTLIGGFVGAILYFITEQFVYAAGGLGLLFLIGTFKPINIPTLYIDTSKDAISIDDEQWLEITDKNKLILTRDYRKRSGGESGGTSYSSIWKLSLETNEGYEKLLEEKISKSSKSDPELFDLAWMNKMGEYVAANIDSATFVDQTGINDEVYVGADAGQSLVQKLQEEDISAYDGSVQEEVEQYYSVSDTTSGIEITEKERNGVLQSFFFLLVFVGASAIFYVVDFPIGFWYIEFDDPVMVFFGLFLLIFIPVAFFGFVFSSYQNQMVVSSGQIKMRRKKLIGHTYSSTMALQNLKEIHIMRIYRNTGIELIGSEHRYALVGGFTEEQAGVIIDFLERVILAKVTNIR